MTLNSFSSASCAFYWFYWFVLTNYAAFNLVSMSIIVWAVWLHFHYGVSFLFLYDVGCLMIRNTSTCIRKLGFGLWSLFKQLDLMVNYSRISLTDDMII